MRRDQLEYLLRGLAGVIESARAEIRLGLGLALRDLLLELDLVTRLERLDQHRIKRLLQPQGLSTLRIGVLRIGLQVRREGAWNQEKLGREVGRPN